MVRTPAIIALSSSGEHIARHIANALKGEVHGRRDRVGDADVWFDHALEHARTLFCAGVPIIGVCASGILIRSVAPLLNDKTREPPVVSVSEDGRVVVPLLGGHRGANQLARDIADLLGVTASVTTAGDVSLGVALDEPPEGWRLVNPSDARGAMARLLAGGGASLQGREAPDAAWLHPLPKGEGVRITCDIAPQDDLGEHHLHFAPTRVCLGVGASRDCPTDELSQLVHQTLRAAEISPAAVHSVNTIDLKADEQAIVDLSRALGVPLRLFEAEELEAQKSRLKNPSTVVFDEVRCHGVAEGAALAQGGAMSELFVPKTKSAMATCAATLLPASRSPASHSSAPTAPMAGHARGRLSVIGIGPGHADWRTPEASLLISQASELVGYSLYLDLLGPLARGKLRREFPLGAEEDRCRYALERAGEGVDVALICSGDAGIYAMAALVFELLERGEDHGGVSPAAKRAEIICAPGISALQGAAARAGAPLGHDFCAISLSDLMTPREDILRRVSAAAQGDFVVAFYNPVSKKRRTLLREARDILLSQRGGETPVILAASLGRPEETVQYRTLGSLHVDEVDMLTVVIVGSSTSRVVALAQGPRVYTPRGYGDKLDRGRA